MITIIILATLMTLAIEQLQSAYLTAAQVQASHGFMGLDRRLIGDRTYLAQSAPSCDFGQVGERFGNVAFGIDDGNHRRGQFAPS